MARDKFRSTTFQPDSAARIELIDDIIAEYEGQKLTARQVYYQLVARDIVPNTPRSYQNLTALLTDARYAGLVDWEAIEDRGREPVTPSEWDTIEEIVDLAIKQFRLPRWAGQRNYVELWVEKQALAGVLAPIARKWHVTLMVNKGYSSASAMKEAADRMIEACGIETDTCCAECDSLDKTYDHDDENGRVTERCDQCRKRWRPKRYTEVQGRQPIVLYLGDHDPSGKDMVRDIHDRLVEFGVTNVLVPVVALTMAQIKNHKPPPNPAKITDSRAKAYIAEFGNQSWELDALPPRELNRLVEAAIGAVVDRGLMDAVIAQEVEDRERMTKAIGRRTP